MKKPLAMLLTLSLLLWAVPALAEGYDDALDAAFEAGRVAFTKADFPLPDLATCEIVAPPDELWVFAGIEPMNEAQMRAALARAELAVFSYAPDGRSGIGMLAVAEGALPFAVSPNRLAIIWPNESRGAYDSYGQLGKVYQRFFLYQDSAPGPFGMGEEGAIWSSSGRYCCVLNSMRVLQEMRLEFGAPLIVDTQTGELFALDTFNPKLMSADGGCWIGGCFAGDDSAFYAMAVSSRYDDPYTLIRYDLETGEAAPCAGFNVNSLPAMTTLADGSIVMLIDTRRETEPQALARVMPDGSIEKHDLLMNGEFWRLRVTNDCCSNESGWALLRGALILSDVEGGGGYFSLLRVNAADGLSEGADVLWMLSGDTLRFEALDAAHMPGTAVEWVQDFVSRHMQVLNMAMSPDGRYAAVFAAGAGARHGESALLIVRLEDMAVLPAQGVDMGNIEPWVMGAVRKQHLLSWSEAGLMVSTSGLWRLQAQG